MAAKFGTLITLVVGIARATSDTSNAVTTIAQRASTLFAQEKQRMKNERVASIQQLEKSMTTTAAIQILQKRNATPALVSMVQGLVQGRVGKSHRNKEQQRFLGMALPTGYSGVEKARDMMNEMLSEVNQKYDLETQHCEAFFNQQCEMMEICRQDISSANAACAGFREQILAAQAEINHCQRELPRLRYELKTSERVCAEKLATLRADLKIVLDDIAVMTSVLEMTDCDKKETTPTAFQQVPDTALVTCNCHGRTVTSFRHPELRDKMSKLKSPKLKQQVMTDLQMLAEPDILGMGYTVNVTNFTNEPVPNEPVPGNPCEGIGFDDAATEAPGGKCSIASNPQCYKLQARFLAIQSGIEDLRDELLTQIEDTEIECHITQELLKGEIAGLEDSLSTEQAKLAAANEGENTAGERGRLKGEEHKTLATDMFSTRDTCSVNLRTFESEQCALKKIRGELGKIQGDNHKPFFQDCEVSEWETEDCSVSCGGGTQKLIRSVIAPPFKGAECPPLEAEQSCEMQTCPIECEMEEWDGWSSCSAECNGGVKQRTRAVKVHPKGDVKPCPESSETTQCNNHACDKDCVLAEWSGWSNCTKACGTGHTHRVREVLSAAVGQGSCAEYTDPTRLELELCNAHACYTPKPKKPLQCFDAIDVILLIDGSASLGAAGWEAAKKFSKTFLSALSETDSMVSMIVFGGPKTFTQYKQCSGTQERDTDFYRDTCGVNLIQHFSADIPASISAIDATEWPASTTMLALALEMAKTEVSLSREGVKTVIVTVTDGLPLSKLKSKKAMKAILNKMGDVKSIVVPVGGKNENGEALLDEEGLRFMKDSIASENKDDNTIAVDGFGQLKDVSTINNIVADMCQNVGQVSCKHWCAANTHPWTTKCTWPATCGACTECP